MLERRGKMSPLSVGKIVFEVATFIFNNPDILKKGIGFLPKRDKEKITISKDLYRELEEEKNLLVKEKLSTDEKNNQKNITVDEYVEIIIRQHRSLLLKQLENSKKNIIKRLINCLFPKK